MTTKLVRIVIDAMDARAQGQFWADALDWVLVGEDPQQSRKRLVSEIGGEPEFIFVTVMDPKVGKNRLHLDLVGGPERTQMQMVDHLLALGARKVDIGQGDVPWEVLADPEGNEFCVLADSDAPRPLAAICLDAFDPTSQGRFWAEATGWVIEREGAGIVVLRSQLRGGPALVLGPPVAPKHAKNRLHLEVAPSPGDDHQREVARLVDAGAAKVDIGQGAVSWEVLADPEGNEFCLCPS